MSDDDSRAGHRSLDTDVIPLGERSLRSILDYVLEVGDEAESSYLEVKSSLDLSSKAGVAKVAKFLLGAANRVPQDAMRYFRGYAVLVIGAEKGSTPGVPRGFEPHELEDSLQRYLGSQFPGYEFGRIPVADDREVLFVIAGPPEDGQSILPCHSDGEGLTNGAIYMRGASNTRTARAGDVLALVARARGGGKPPIELDLQVLGPISRVDGVDELLNDLYDITEEGFTKPREPAEDNPLAALLRPSILGRTQPLTPEERQERLELWRRQRPTHIEQGREHCLGVALPGVGIQVVSNRFVGRPHLTVTFHNCEVIDYRNADDADYKKVVEPIVQSHPLVSGFDAHQIRPAGYAVDWRNRGDDAEITITPDSFRPGTPWTSDQDDYVVITRDPSADAVSGTWTLTEDGNDVVTSGEVEVPTGDLMGAAELLKTSFLTE